MLWAIGAGEQVVAVDDQSNYPEGVPTTDLSGYEPNIEAIASFDPDLVVYATEPGDLGSSLDQLGIPALQQPAATSLDDVYGQIEQLGEVTDHVPAASDLADGMRASVSRHGLRWHVPHLGPRAGYQFQPTPIRTGAEGWAAADELLTRLIRVWLANRGVWEAIVGAGPVCSVPCSDADVDAYLGGWDSLLDALTA